jgi:LPS-assembly protein
VVKVQTLKCNHEAMLMPGNHCAGLMDNFGSLFAACRMPRHNVLGLLCLVGALAHGWAQGQSNKADEQTVELQADEVSGKPDVEATASGRVELRKGPITLKTDSLRYDVAKDRVSATGQVSFQTANGDRFSGRSLELTLDSFQGSFLEPEYFLARTGASGRAERIDFLGRQRTRLIRGNYSSCDRDGGGTPDWLLETRRVTLNVEANEGIAEGAVLRFLGVPILALPVLSFPLTGDRKSGWLPPSVNIDNKSGLELAVPYYWNIAPHRDATLTPIVLSRRGLAMDTEFRYLEPHHQGELRWFALPRDRVQDAARNLVHWQHEGGANDSLRWGWSGQRVDDDQHWKDFPRTLEGLTPRLLHNQAQLERDVALGQWSTTAYARSQWWQVLQSTDPLERIASPYHRAPQLGWRGERLWDWRADGSPAVVQFETEFNRFSLPGNELASTPLRSEGTRWHALVSAEQRWRWPGAWLTPQARLNLASYRTDEPMSDARKSASRAIPSVGFDGGFIFERDMQWRGRAMRQTLEPRLLYVNTPYRDQLTLPLYDAAAKDFNTVSVFSDNTFSGIDRVADLHQITFGATTRLLEPDNGAEALRLSVAQRYLLRDQRITPDGVPLTNRFSDLLLAGSGALSRRWSVEGALQYSPEIDRLTRSVWLARYSPGPQRSVSFGYRLARSTSEQLDIGWQWPIFKRESRPASDSSCKGSLYSVGRINYSMKDSRITDSLAGIEYDAGCWIGRVVAERVSTGRSEATTRLMLQLELVGLSRLGSNPLKVLKDNIPGYTLLREDTSDPPLKTYAP